MNPRMPPKPRSSKKKAVTLRLDANLVDELRGFCRDHAGKPLYLTLSGVAEAALAEHLESLKRRVDRDELVDANSRPRRGPLP